MKSLNEIYNENKLFYYCNACGDINIPDTDPLSYHDVGELPLRERNLYENYWCEGAGCYMYVVNYNGNPAMALGFLFDVGYCDDLTEEIPNLNNNMDKFWVAVKDCANLLSKDTALNGCEVLAGHDTDPDGHEILIIIPYNMRDKINEITHDFADKVYADFEALL